MEALARSLDLDSMLVYTRAGLYGWYEKASGFVRYWGWLR
jgi:hypothetical protein